MHLTSLKFWGMTVNLTKRIAGNIFLIAEPKWLEPVVKFHLIEILSYSEAETTKATSVCSGKSEDLTEIISLRIRLFVACDCGFDVVALLLLGNIGVCST